MTSPDQDPSRLSFHAVRYADRGDLAVQRPALHAFLGTRFFEDHSKNPDTREESPCFFALMNSEDEVVSSISCWADTLTVRGRDYPWIWTGGLQTCPAWRGRGLATRLQEESTRYVQDLAFGRGSVFSTDATLHIYRKLGYLQPGFIQRYLFLQSATPLIRGRMTRPWLRAVAAGAAWPFWVAGNAALRLANRVRPRKADFVELDSCGKPDLEQVLSQIAATRDVHFNLSADKLKWKLGKAARGSGTTSLYLLSPRNGNLPIGYAVVRLRQQTEPLAERYKDFSMLSLMDYGLVSEAEADYAAILANLLQLAMERRAEVMEVISHAPEVRRLALRYGLLPVGRGMSFSAMLPPTCEATGLDLNALSTWRVTHYSGDGINQ